MTNTETNDTAATVAAQGAFSSRILNSATSPRVPSKAPARFVLPLVDRAAQLSDDPVRLPRALNEQDICSLWHRSVEGVLTVRRRIALEG
jgi:hypothetical protein